MSSSDDDIMGLLPTGRGRGRGAQAPSRLRNFKAMMSDSSDDEKGTPTPKPGKKPLPDLTSPATKTPTPVATPVTATVASAPVRPVSPAAVPAVVAPKVMTPPLQAAVQPPSDDDDESSHSGDSIQFLEGDGELTNVKDADSDEVSLDLQSTMDDVTPLKQVETTPPPVAKKPTAQVAVAAAPPPKSPPRSPPRAITPPRTPSPVKVPATRAADTEKPKPAVATRTSSPPLARPAATIQEAVREEPRQQPSQQVHYRDTTVAEHHEENDLLQEILPLHPRSASTFSKPPVAQSVPSSVPLARTRSPSANANLLTSAAHLPPPSPVRADPLEELLIRAQQRLREKERLDQSLGSLPPPAPASRQSSPLRPIERRVDMSFQATTNGALFSTMPASPIDAGATRELRLQKENQRLAEELAFLTKENQKLRSPDNMASVNEVHKLQVHVEVLKQQLKEVELDGQRTKQYLEEQLQDAQQHERHMQDELKSYAATADQVDAMCREKDSKLHDAQQQIVKLQSSMADRVAEVRRAEEEGRRARDDDKTKLERTLQLFEDVKKQRVQLQELNDKFQRDKDAALADKRRAVDELRSAEREWNKDRDRLVEDSEALHRDVERYRQLIVEKERTLHAQIAEEQRAKEHFQTRLADLEDSVTTQQQTVQASLRSAQEELRRSQDELNKVNRLRSEEVKELTLRLDEQTKEFNLNIQRERSAVIKEMSEKVSQWKEQRDAAEERRRVAEEHLEKVAQERDMYRKEVERSTEINGQWQRAKDKAEMQCVQLKSSLEQIIAQDEQLVNDTERYRSELEAAYQDIANLRAEVEQSFYLEKQLQDLSAENDRISDECTRVTEERNSLIQENARMAEEMIRWRNEMKDLFATQKRSSTLPMASAGAGSIGLPSSRSGSQRAVRALSSNDFTF